MPHWPPNFFRFATKELAQDAVLAYILAWAAPRVRKEASPDSHEWRMNRLGADLLQALVRAYPDDALKNWSSESVTGITVTTQKQHIDVLADVMTSEGGLLLLIEDKTFTTEGPGQIRGYVDNLQKANRDSRVLPVYVKTGNESHNNIKRKLSLPDGIGIFGREELLEVLAKHRDTTSRIVDEFRTRWSDFDRCTKRFVVEPPASWRWEQCEGYFDELERRLANEGVYSWWHPDTIRYVGTFRHLWCSEISNRSDGITVRVQIRCDNSGLNELTVQAYNRESKVVDNSTLHRLFREYTGHACLLGADASLDKSGNFRKGSWPRFLLATFDNHGRDRSYFARDTDGLIDMTETVCRIIRVCRFLEDATRRIQRTHDLFDSVVARLEQKRANGGLPGWKLDVDGRPVRRVRLHREDHWSQHRFSGVWLVRWEPTTTVRLGVEWPNKSDASRDTLRQWFVDRGLRPEESLGGRRAARTTYLSIDVSRLAREAEHDDKVFSRFVEEQTEQVMSLAADIDRTEGRRTHCRGECQNEAPITSEQE